ncbi:putative protein arginine N-methyltransferase 6 [Senna tora]|uniref:Uncharacterized protein n=1 Tax=Senna tora TaxID=362788 RepID=A0A834TST8_9FABA|nr:putative protein arginine N-methyltransferase 6 [Senna tora]
MNVGNCKGIPTPLIAINLNIEDGQSADENLLEVSAMLPLAKQCAFEEPSVETITGENVLTWPHVVSVLVNAIVYVLTPLGYFQMLNFQKLNHLLP